METKINFEAIKKATRYRLRRLNVDEMVDSTFVKNLRSDLNMTQNVFADLLGVTKKTIEKWEQGKNPVKGPSAILLYLIEKDKKILDHFYSFVKINPITNEIENVLYKDNTEAEMYITQLKNDDEITENINPVEYKCVESAEKIDAVFNQIIINNKANWAV